MKNIRYYLIAFILILWSASAIGKGCEFDSQCKGDRICENGRCVSEGGGGGGDGSRGRSRSDSDSGRGNRLPNYCCTAAGKLGPYPNSGIPEGGSCYGTHPAYGPMMGQACY